MISMPLEGSREGGGGGLVTGGGASAKERCSGVCWVVPVGGVDRDSVPAGPGCSPHRLIREVSRKLCSFVAEINYYSRFLRHIDRSKECAKSNRSS